MNIVDEIRKKQDDIILMVNSIFDELVEKVSYLDNNESKDYNSFESIYPLTNTSGFKGKKVIAVIIDNERQIVPTWKVLVDKVFKHVLSNEVYKQRIFLLSDRVLGRKRTRLSSSSTDMKSPLKLDDNLYLETHYDTETLLNLLLQILNEISYDYNDIKVVIKN